MNTTDKLQSSEHSLTSTKLEQNQSLKELTSELTTLKEEKSQLVALMTNLEQTREQLVEQLQETQKVLDLEREMRSKILKEREDVIYIV
jgi:hypothetical protein